MSFCETCGSGLSSHGYWLDPRGGDFNRWVDSLGMEVGCQTRLVIQESRRPSSRSDEFPILRPSLRRKQGPSSRGSAEPEPTSLFQ